MPPILLLMEYFCVLIFGIPMILSFWYGYNLQSLWGTLLLMKWITFNRWNVFEQVWKISEDENGYNGEGKHFGKVTIHNLSEEHCWWQTHDMYLSKCEKYQRMKMVGGKYFGGRGLRRLDPPPNIFFDIWGFKFYKKSNTFSNVQGVVCTRIWALWQIEA